HNRHLIYGDRERNVLEVVDPRSPDFDGFVRHVSWRRLHRDESCGGRKPRMVTWIATRAQMRLRVLSVGFTPDRSDLFIDQRECRRCTPNGARHLYSLNL